MRKELVLVLVIVMGAALVVYKRFGASSLPFHFPQGVVRTERPIEPGPEPPGKTAESKTSPKTVRGDKSKILPDRVVKPETAASPQPAEPASPSRPRPARPFPMPDTLKKGLASKELLATYGEPDFHVAGASGGRVIEKYYYVSADRNQLTLIIVENGLLTSASFIPGPYFQLPAPGKPEPSQGPKKP